MFPLFLTFCRSEIIDLGIEGHTFSIEEDNILDVLQKKLSEIEKNGQLDIHQKKIQKEAIMSVKNPKGRSLPLVIKNRIFYVDPTTILENDVKDQSGKVLFSKGTHVNPFNYVTMTKPLFFIDGHDKKQINKACELLEKNSKTKIILVQGKPFDLMEKYNIPIYFDQFGRLIQKLGIQRAPTLVVQDGMKLKLEEISCE